MANAYMFIGFTSRIAASQLAADASTCGIIANQLAKFESRFFHLTRGGFSVVGKTNTILG